MAKTASPPVVEPSTAEKIKRAIAELRAREAEAKEYDAKAAELASTDYDGSIKADEHGRAVERFCARQRAVIEDLVNRLHLEQLAERDKQIDELVVKKMREAEELADRLRKASDEFFEAALRLSAIVGVSMPGLSGHSLLGWEPGQQPKLSPFLKRIDDALFGRRQQLARGGSALKTAARNPAHYPVNTSDGLAFTELRDALPPFALEKIEIPEPAPEPVAAEALTN